LGSLLVESFSVFETNRKINGGVFMKSFLIAIIAIIVVAPPCRAQEEDQFIPEEPRKAKKQKEVITHPIEENPIYNTFLIGGLGYSIIVDRKYPGFPTITLGYELPFNDRHKSSFQINSYILVEKNESYDGSVNSVNDFYYSYGLSGVFKFYILDENSDFRLSLHFGTSFFYSDNFAPCFDLGLAGYYRVSKKISLSMDGRINILLPGLVYGFPFVSLVTTLNMNYYLEW
jgi:hypothetical protein